MASEVDRSGREKRQPIVADDANKTQVKSVVRWLVLLIRQSGEHSFQFLRYFAGFF
jgi:hypothetical protein